MRTLLVTFLIVTAVVPLASANHGCGGEWSTQTHGTVTIDEESYRCHSTYFGTGYYQEYTWEQDSTRVSESTTGARLTVYTYSWDDEFVSQSYGSSGSVGDSAGLYAQVGDQTVYASVGDSQSSSTTWGCNGGTGAQAGTYSNDGQTSVYNSLYRGDLRNVPCVPQGLREML